MAGASFHGVLTYVYGDVLKTVDDVAALLRAMIETCLERKRAFLKGVK